MPIFPIDDSANAHRAKAKEILLHANDIAEHLKALFISSYNLLWSVPGYTVADAQAVIDQMELLSPGSSVASFQIHGAFGEFLNAMHPGAVPAQMLTSPVAYEVVDSKIVLTGETYPE